LQNSTVDRSRLGDLLVGDVDRAGKRSLCVVLGLAAVDAGATGAQVLDHLELADRPHARRENHRRDDAPRRVDHEPARAPLDRLRHAVGLRAPRQAVEAIHRRPQHDPYPASAG
jgi:hypothetical protein